MAKKSGGTGKDKKDARSAKTGQYVSKAYAKKHPGTTVVEITRTRRGKPEPSPPVKKKK